MNLSQYTPAELGITGHYLRVHSKVAPGWLPIVHDVLDWAQPFTKLLARAEGAAQERAFAVAQEAAQEFGENTG